MPKKEPAPKKNKPADLTRNIVQAFLLFLLLIVSAVSIFLILFDLNFSGKIYPGIAIAGQNTSDIAPKAAQQLIENRIASWENKKIRIEYSDPADLSSSKKWEVVPETMGYMPSASKTTLAAYNYGRVGNPLQVIKQKISIITKTKDLPVYYDLSESKFSDYFSANLSFLEKSSKDASLEFVDGKVAEIPAQNGYKINEISLKEKMSSAIAALSGDKPLLLEITPVSPDITDEKTREAESQAKNLLASKLSLRFEDKVWELDNETVRSSIDFEKENNILNVKIDPNPILDYLEKIQLEINREPSNAIFGEKDGNIVIESGGETGAVLGLDSSAKKISEEMLAASKTDNKNIEVKLVIEEKDPDIGKKKLDALGINALIGQGTSNFAGSPKNRRYNIGVGAAKFNNIIIPKDKEFSFVETLGEVTTKAGYLPELVIKGDRTIPELGGGLCQVSTTAFRAAIYAGLPILERKPHAYPVAYYNPQGMDSTIYPPHPDLKFKNDTGGDIFVQTKIDKNELIFNFFGIKQSRVIKIIGPNTYDRQANGALKAVFWREFYDGDKLIKKEPFYSSYSSPAKYPHKNPLE